MPFVDLTLTGEVFLFFVPCILEADRDLLLILLVCFGCEEFYFAFVIAGHGPNHVVRLDRKGSVPLEI